MSYPSVPESGYAAYYNATTSPTSTYNSVHQPGNHAFNATQPYQSGVRQHQQNTSSYDWQHQNQVGYNNLGQAFGGEPYRESGGQGNSYDYRMEASNVATQAAAGSRPDQYYGNTTLNPNVQNTQGLDNLAYASGLDNVDLRKSSNKVSSTTQYNVRPSSAIQNRVDSPIQHNSHRYPDNAASYGTKSNSNAAPSQNLAMSAATALAGAVSRRFPHGVSPDNQEAIVTMDGNHSNRTMSSQQQPTSASHAQRKQPQHHVTPSSSYAQGRSANNSTGRVMSPVEIQHPSKTPHALGEQSAQQSKAKPQPVQDHQKRPTAQQISSISNLVNNLPQTSQQDNLPSHQEPPHMPNYIDPSQVFNPYHKEHERRRREAAQAEAEAKRTEAEAEARRREVESETKRKQAEDAARREEMQDGNFTNQSVGQTMNASPATSKKHSSSKSATGPSSKKSTPASKMKSPEEDEMAAEMRMMMEKMKEFRNKDPALFQKLLEEMKKGGSSSSTGIPVTRTPPPQMLSGLREVHGTRSLNLDRTSLPGQQQTQMPHSVPSTTTTLLQKNSTPTTPSTFGGNANGYRVVVENNPEGLPDLGRFPAERRIRPSGKKKENATGSPPNPPANIVVTDPVPPRQVASTVPPINFALNGLPQAPVPQIGPLQPQSIKPAMGAIVWPEEKRNSLISAAIRALRAVPENASLQIYVSDFDTMLDQNPSYIELCEMLEKKGFKFHRAYFARQLLHNVPELATPQTPAPAPAPAPQAVSQQTSVQGSQSQLKGSSIQFSSTVPLQNTTPSMVQGHLPIAAPLPTTAAPTNNTSETKLGLSQMNTATDHHRPLPNLPTMSQRPGSHQIPPPPIPTASIKREYPQYGMLVPGTFHKPGKVRMASGTQIRNEPVPGVKEAMARKRDFSELVDLTQLSDNEDYVLSNKHVRVNSPSPEPDYFKKFQPDNSIPRTSGPVLKPGEPLRFDPTQVNPAPRVVLSQQRAPTPPQPRQKTILAKRVNKAEALRKSFYDPKTVARDVLIAAGRHPAERPLNAHLAGLLAVHIDLDSDLSTFDWDAIDPGGPSMPKVDVIDIPAGPPRIELGKRVFNEQTKRSGPESDRESRLPETDKRGSAPFTSSSLSRFAAQSKQLFQESTQPKSAHQAPTLNTSHTFENISEPVVPQKRKASVISVDLSPASQGQTVHLLPSRTPETKTALPTGPKRRGRPPGSKNKATSLNDMRQAARIEPRIEVSIPSSPPTHKVYKCKWIKCEARLHNLETLQRHVEKVHRPRTDEIEQHEITCWWKECPTLKTELDRSITVLQYFENQDEWMQHIRDNHLHTIAMKYGDGPPASTSHIGKPKTLNFDLSQYLYNPSNSNDARTFSYLDPQSTTQVNARFLNDEHGRATTPKLSMHSNKDLPADTLSLTKANSEESDIVAHRSFLKAHRTGRAGPMGSAEETLRAMTARKAKVGPGIDRGGCTLVNDARRATLVQNQGLARVVEADY